MDQNPRKSSTRIRFWQRIRDWHVLGLLILVGVASSIGSALFIGQPGGSETTGWWEGFLQNFSTEMYGAFLTFLLIEVLVGARREKEAEARDLERERARLIREMGGPDNGLALRAVRELRAYGWLTDGSLHGTDLARANLAGADLSDANLNGVDLSDANLTEAYMRRVNLENADLRRANLSGANLRDSLLDDATFIRATLDDAKLRASTLIGTRCFGASMRGAELTDCNLTEARMMDTDLSAARMRGTILAGANFVRANLTGIEPPLDREFVSAEGFWLATMPDGTRYDGRYQLYGDRDAAYERQITANPRDTDPLNLEDIEKMAAVYEVTPQDYERGLAWAKQWAIKQQVIAQSKDQD